MGIPKGVAVNAITQLKIAKSREQKHVITHHATEIDHLFPFTPHAEEVVHAITRLKIEFHVFTPQNLPNHAERNISLGAPLRYMIS